MNFNNFFTHFAHIFDTSGGEGRGTGVYTRGASFLPPPYKWSGKKIMPPNKSMPESDKFEPDTLAQSSQIQALSLQSYTV